MLDNMENDPNDFKDRIELEQVFEEERDESYPQTQRSNPKPGTAEASKSNATSLNHSLAKKNYDQKQDSLRNDILQNNDFDNIQKGVIIRCNTTEGNMKFIPNQHGCNKSLESMTFNE